MGSTMTRKRIFNCFILIIYCRSAFAQVGDSCTVKSTGSAGVCKISEQCPIAREQAESGISPTICGYSQLTNPIVCCEVSPFLEPNDGSLEPSPPATPAPQKHMHSHLSGHREPNPNTLPEEGSFVYPEHENENRPVPQSLSKSEQKCQEYSKNLTGSVQAIPLVTDTEAISVNIAKCDYNGVALIVGGKPASVGEFPFMAAIGFYENNKVEWRCGGTLISNKYVLTAAHCTYARDDPAKVVRLGELDLARDDEGRHADYNIRKIIVHPKYKSRLKYYDIALLQLSVVQFTDVIRPACLYTDPQVRVQQGVATGWGKLDFAGDVSKKLMKVALTLYKNEECSRTYNGVRYLPHGITSNMLCAGELKGDKDTCQGDSGGPLLITPEGNRCKFYVIGITSFGKGCGQPNTPAVYTRVSSFVPWIESIVW